MAEDSIRWQWDFIMRYIQLPRPTARTTHLLVPPSFYKSTLARGKARWKAREEEACWSSNDVGSIDTQFTE